MERPHSLCWRHCGGRTDKSRASWTCGRLFTFTARKYGPVIRRGGESVDGGEDEFDGSEFGLIGGSL